jgi:hypothetical protein
MMGAKLPKIKYAPPYPQSIIDKPIGIRTKININSTGKDQSASSIEFMNIFTKFSGQWVQKRADFHRPAPIPAASKYVQSK